MDIELLTEFFKWCTLINLGILIMWSVVFIAMPDFVYKVQTRFVPITRESFNNAMYLIIGGYKILFIVFCVTPYVALLIMTK